MYGRMELKQMTVRIILVVQARITHIAVTVINLKSISEDKGANPAYLDGSSTVREHLQVSMPKTLKVVDPLIIGYFLHFVRLPQYAP
jgi:hypothetical protein